MRAAGDAIIAGGRAYRIGDGFHRSIARAILAERERCAERAEGLDRQGREWVPDSLWENIKRDTAAAIRRSDSEA
ncbi:MAG: hypothetical protein E5W72_03990 [Mesorhizobium sp.]|nr:MAG: hypothetical protein E5W72_03990 [Mesorhizobium sp.]